MIDGFTFTKRLLIGDSRFLVIGVSADIDVGVSTRAKDVGMIDLVLKPLTLANVAGVLLRHGFITPLQNPPPSQNDDDVTCHETSNGPAAAADAAHECRVHETV